MAGVTTDLAEVAHLLMNWRTTMSPVPTAVAAGKTTDPEAETYERAIGLLREGLKRGRNGDLETARVKIAAAYLLDYRVSRWCVPMVPPNDEEASYCMLDTKFLTELATFRNGPNTPRASASDELDSASNILLTMLLHRSAQTAQQNQAACTSVIVGSRDMIDRISKDPDKYEHNPRVLEGHLSRVRLHHMMSVFFDAIKEFKRGSRELRRAVALDQDNMQIRAKRIMTDYGMGFEKLPAVIQECKEILLSLHEDSRYRRSLYAILASVTLDFPAAGTFEEAMGFFNKMNESLNRYIQIHGEKEVELQQNHKHIRQAREILSEFDEAAIHQRRGQDVRMSSSQKFRNECQEDLETAGFDPFKRACKNCGKVEGQEGLKLMKCSRCKQAAYCSRECQKDDWKYHKESCKLFKK